MEDNSPHLFGLSPLTIAIIGIIAASAGLLIYHFIVVSPECLHTFHACCIDMWLFSHSNCPLCRADMGVSEPAHHQSESDTFRLPGSGIKVPYNRV
uniref:RING-type E3 ubiquitin transferase n=1 Tax=Populus trichocarpa TaxID=3694 RepID=A0A2K1ZC96_POPTR